MVRHCAILGGFFSSPRRNICTPQSEHGTTRNAIEAGDSCFIARGGGRRRLLRRAGIGCLLRSGVVESRAAGCFDTLAAYCDDRLRLDLRLSSYRETTKVTGVSDRHPRHPADTVDLRARFSFDFTQRNRRSGSAWTTPRVLTLDSIQTNLILDGP